MKRIFAVALLAGCSRYYNNSELTLIVNSSAKETCSCIFVLGRSEESCKDYSRLIGPTQIVQFQIDRGNGTVDAQLAGWHAAARFSSPELGCVLQ